MARRWTIVEGLRFVFVDNPFFAVLWQQQRRWMAQWFWHLGLILGTLFLVFIGAMALLQRFSVPSLFWGKVLFEVIAWTHLLAGSIYNEHLARRVRHFFREEVHSDLLLTGVPPFWLVVASYLYPLFRQIQLSVLCLPFYAAAAVLSGLPWSTVLVTAALITLFVSPLPFRSSGAESLPFHFWRFWLWFAFLGWLRSLDLRGLASPSFWSSFPFWLGVPVRVYEWDIPLWVLLACALPCSFLWSAMVGAWQMEQRFYSHQIRVRNWSDGFIVVAALFVVGLCWAYLPAPSFQFKFALAVACFWLVLFGFFIVNAPTFPLQNPARLSAGAHTAGLAMWTISGIAAGVSIREWATTVALGTVLATVQVVSFHLSYGWWRRLMSAKDGTPGAWWLLFLVWLLAPTALLSPFLAPLAAVQGWLVPASLLLPSLPQLFLLRLPIATEWHLPLGQHTLSLPLWLPMLVVQLAWGALLRFAERIPQKTAILEGSPKEHFTPQHLLWGWLVQLEERWCERWQNPLVNLQLRWQRRFSALATAMNTQVALLLFLALLFLAAQVFPLPALIGSATYGRYLLSPLAGVVGAFVGGRVLIALQQKMALWRLGHKRVLESFVLAPIAEWQWVWGLWFPRFWLSVKAMLPSIVAVWWGAVLVPEASKFLLAGLITTALLVSAFMWSAHSLAKDTLSPIGAFVLELLLLVCAFVFGAGLFFLALAHPILKTDVPLLVGWGLFLFSQAALAAVVASFLPRLKQLRTPNGYEKWLAAADDKAQRIAQRRL